MGLTSAMYTSLSGLDANQMRIETIGHNIANVNTTAYKGARTLFQTQFAETLSMGTRPSDTSGGTNPMQIGRGVVVGSTQRSTSGGSVQTTGLPADMAIEGGEIAVQTSDGQQYYTRDGSFTLNQDNVLVSQDGKYLLGYGVDEAYQVTSGQLQHLTIPLGALSIARASQNVTLAGDLSAAERIATQGSIQTSQPLVQGDGTAVVASTALADVRSADVSGTPLFSDGDIITVMGATRGGRSLPVQQFTVGTTGATLGDFATWLNTALGIQADPALGGEPGASVVDGALVIRSNTGEPNAIELQTNNIVSSNVAAPLPFVITQTAEAVGSGSTTGFTVYDSLGNPVNVRATFTLDSTPPTGPVWRYFLEVPATETTPASTGTGLVVFDTNGNFVSATGNQLDIDRTGTGAASPLNVTIDFSDVNGLSTNASNVTMSSQDGYPPGTLTGFGIGEDGTIAGTFSNGTSRTLGQVALASFSNEAGLVAKSDNLYAAGPNSGAAAINTPGTLGAGLIHSGALELSNVDLSNEFIGLITSSTGFQANSRVITVTSEMLDQLLMALR